jgi:hypothetical protein
MRRLRHRRPIAAPPEILEAAKRADSLWGEIVSWDLPTLRVSYGRIKDALDAADLPTGSLASLRSETALRRALADMREGRLIDKVATTGDGRTIFQLTPKALLDERVTYCVGTTVVMNSDGTLSEGEGPGAEETRDRAQMLLDAALEERTTADVRQYIQGAFAACADLMPIARRKGVAYFVPSPFASFVTQFETLLDHLGGQLNRFPILRGATPQGDLSVTRTIDAALEAHAEELEDALAQWTDATREGTCDRLLELWRAVKHKTLSYGEFLGDRRAKMLARMEEIKDAIGKRWQEITATRAEADARKAETAGDLPGQMHLPGTTDAAEGSAAE